MWFRSLTQIWFWLPLQTDHPFWRLSSSLLWVDSLVNSDFPDVSKLLIQHVAEQVAFLKRKKNWTFQMLQNKELIRMKSWSQRATMLMSCILLNLLQCKHGGCRDGYVWSSCSVSEEVWEGADGGIHTCLRHKEGMLCLRPSARVCESNRHQPRGRQGHRRDGAWEGQRGSRL